MAAIDRLPADFRALVHEYGWVIVRDMRADGHCDAAKLRGELETWRRRRQDALLER
jgi:hypothetical protein